MLKGIGKSTVSNNFVTLFELHGDPHKLGGPTRRYQLAQRVAYIEADGRDVSLCFELLTNLPRHDIERRAYFRNLWISRNLWIFTGQDAVDIIMNWV